VRHAGGKFTEGRDGRRAQLFLDLQDQVGLVAQFGVAFLEPQRSLR
jgi:hypothetical protein